jgi:ribosomal protein S18 acetylase RimI-like enzyme
MPISVRPARLDDRAFIDNLGATSALETISPLRLVPHHVAAEGFRKLLEYCDGRSRALLVAERDGQRAGFAIVLFDLMDEVSQRPQAFIAYMAVASAHRRRGVATALLDAAEEEARRAGLSHLTLMVTEAAEPARSLYAKTGFQDERVQMTKPIARAAR